MPKRVARWQPAAMRRARAAWHGASPLRRWLVVVVLLAALPHVPGLASDFGRSLLTQMGIAAVFALSYNVLFGQTGLLSFGHAVYFGLGGYAADPPDARDQPRIAAADAARAARRRARGAAVRPRASAR